MANAVVEALERAAERIGKTLSKDAGKAVEDMYRSAGKGTEDVVKRITEADAEHAGKLVALAEQLGKDGGKTLTGDAAKAEQGALRGRFASVLDPESTSGGRSASSFLHNDAGVPGVGTKRLGTLAESDVTRDGNGLITHVNGQPADDYLNSLSKERAGAYVQANRMAPSRAASRATASPRAWTGGPAPSTRASTGRGRMSSIRRICTRRFKRTGTR